MRFIIFRHLDCSEQTLKETQSLQQSEKAGVEKRKLVSKGKSPCELNIFVVFKTAESSVKISSVKYI